MLPSCGTSPLALVKEREMAFFLQADKKIVPAISGTRKVLIRIKVWLIKFMNEKLKKFDDVKNLAVDFLPAGLAPCSVAEAMAQATEASAKAMQAGSQRPSACAGNNRN